MTVNHGHAEFAGAGVDVDHPGTQNISAYAGICKLGIPVPCWGWHQRLRAN